MESKQLIPRLVEVASRFAALGSEQRLSVLITLVRAGPDGLTIGELGDRTGVTGSTLTHHMRVLSQSGLVAQTRDGRRILSTADYDAVESLAEFLTSQCCADTGASDQDHSHG